jgi:hypothetical protein
MSWLEELEYNYEYVCKEGHSNLVKCKASEQPSLPKTIECESCSLEAEYMGAMPIQMGGTAIVQFDKNGRVGYAITTGGKTTYISKTKMNYLKTGKNQSGFTKEYKEHTADKMAIEFGHYRKELESNAKVSTASKKDTEL